VHEVVRHRESEVASDRPGCGVGRIRRADRRPQRRDRPLPLDDEGQRRPRGDEVDQLAEERLLAMLRVVLFAEARSTRSSFAARSVKPRRSIRPRISPASARSTASGLIRIRLRSMAIG